ncbi:MAG: glutamate racemase [Erysipelotrichaceae bacterium]|nr:glutamate racemase [Erysipelotrichaceae bacterium]
MIGVLDSGLGGIVTLKYLLEQIPDTSFVCLADQANAPYGDKSNEQLFQIAKRHIKWFESQNVTTVLIACNTLCSTVLPQLRQEFPMMHLIDIVTLTCEDLMEEPLESLLLLATERSIQSGVYERKIQKSHPTCKVYPLAASQLVPLLEQNQPIEIIKKVLHEYLDEYQGKVQSVLLGCTHYPLVASEIEKIVSARTYDSRHAIVKAIPHEHLNQREVKIYTTLDAEQTQQQIADLLNMNDPVVQL